MEMTRVGEYAAAGTRMLSIVPINDLWAEANYRETQIGRMKVGDPVRIDVNTYPGKPICGYVEAILPATGSEFAMIPPDNAQGQLHKDRTPLHRAHPLQSPRRQRRSRPSRHVGGNRRRGLHAR